MKEVLQQVIQDAKDHPRYTPEDLAKQAAEAHEAMILAQEQHAAKLRRATSDIVDVLQSKCLGCKNLQCHFDQGMSWSEDTCESAGFRLTCNLGKFCRKDECDNAGLVEIRSLLTVGKGCADFSPATVSDEEVD